MILKLYLFCKKLLNKSEKKYFKIILLLILVGTFLETLSIGAVIPILKILVSQDLGENFNNLLETLKLNNHSQSQLFLLSLACLFIIFSIKSIFLSFLKFKQFNYLANVKINLSKNFFSLYLNKPYIYHLKTNSYILTRNLLNVNEMSGVMQTIIDLIAEITVFTAILILLFFYEPLGATTSILIFGLFGYFFQKKVRKLSNKWGEERLVHDGFKLKNIKQGFAAIKEIKLFRIEKNSIEEFYRNSKISGEAEFKFSFVSSLPRIWLEWIIVLVIITLVLVLNINNSQAVNYIPALGFFGAAAFRLMPSISRMMIYIQSLRYHLPIVESLSNELIDSRELNKIKNKNGSKENNMSQLKNFSKKIEIENLNFIYPDTQKKLLSDVNLKIKHGSIIGIVGESGVGKTTLINLLLGLIKPSSGKISADGFDIFKDLEDWQSQIGYVPQNVYLNDDTIRKNIAFGLSDDLINDNHVKKAIKDSQLGGFINNLEKKDLTTVGECGDRLSGGQKQRIGIARALYRNPKLLIMDESTNSLDFNTEQAILKEVNMLKGKKTILIIAHRSTALNFCENIYKLSSEGLSETNLKN